MRAWLEGIGGPKPPRDKWRDLNDAIKAGTLLFVVVFLAMALGAFWFPMAARRPELAIGSSVVSWLIAVAIFFDWRK
jgi:uncharacterized membrane protein (GlpM family)